MELKQLEALRTIAETGRFSAAERIFSEINGIRQHFPTSSRGPVVGTLRVAATSLGIAYIYGDLCEAFVARHPGIELIFRAAETPEQAVQRVVTGSADVAFTPLPMALPQVQTVSLGTTEHVFIVARSHPLARAKEVTLEELRKWPFVRFQAGTGSRIASDQVFLPDGGYPAVVTETNDAEFAKRIVAMGTTLR